MSAQQGSNYNRVFEQVAFLGPPPLMHAEQLGEYLACLKRAWEFFDPQDEIKRILFRAFVDDRFKAVPVRQLVRGLMTPVIALATKTTDEEDEDPLDSL